MTGGLLETQETFKVDHLVLKEKMFLWMMVDPIMHCFPLPGEDAIVLHNHLLNPIFG